MKKKFCALLSLLLCAILLAGCGSGGAVPAINTALPEATETTAPVSTQPPYVAPTDVREGFWDLVPFDEMPYSRPDLDLLREAITTVEVALDNGADYETVESLLDSCQYYYTSFYTMYSLAYIRSCQNMTDDFYAEEFAACDEASADLSQLMEDLYFLCGMSDMAEELEEKYFWPGFAAAYADDANAIYDDTMVQLMQQESALIVEYRSLVASPTIVLADGSEADLYTTLEEKTGYERLDAIMRYYEQYNPRLSEVYIELIKVRQAQAAHLGYDSYEEMAFDYGFERDYSPELAADYIQDVKRYIVPLYQEVMVTNPYWTLDSGALSAERLEEILRAGVSSMGEEVLDTYDFMVQYRLYDIGYSPLKAEMSFEMYLSCYEVPFLFMDSTGELEDITTFSHEFGHYLDGYINYDADETIDLAECYSQAMELLMLTRLDGALSEKELDSLYRAKMLDILETYVQQASFAEFEHIVYAADPEELSAEFLNQLSLRLAQEYGYYSPGYEGFYAMTWQDITHFFEQPFYVITYPVSLDIAMQIFQLEQGTPGAGLEKYLDILPREYGGMLDTALNGGLESPFDPGRLEKVAATLREILLDGAANAA